MSESEGWDYANQLEVEVRRLREALSELVGRYISACTATGLPITEAEARDNISNILEVLG